MEADAALQIDTRGVAFGGGGLMPTLRNLARFGSHPIAGNVAIDPIALPAYHAMARRLIRK